MSKVKSYVDGVNWPFEVLLDPNEDLKRELNFQTIPYTLMLDKEGNIVYTHNGYQEGDEYVLEEKIKEYDK
jgi:thioredoxin-related protein